MKTPHLMAITLTATVIPYHCKTLHLAQFNLMMKRYLEEYMPMMKVLMTMIIPWPTMLAYKDSPTKRNSTFKMLSLTKTVNTPTSRIQLNIRRLERDFRTESLQLEVDKERRLIKRNLKRLFTIKIRLLRNLQVRKIVYLKWTVLCQVRM